MSKEKKLSSLSSEEGGCRSENIIDESSISSSIESDSSSSNSGSRSCPGGKGC